MIKAENAKVYNIAKAIYGARNAMNSWEKSDSDLEKDIIGPEDLKLAKRLVKSGSDHRKFMRQIFISVDITAPLYWWKEYDTYKVATVANSCSTMHTIHKKEITLDDFSHEELTPVGLKMLKDLIKWLNFDRICFLEQKEKKYWYEIIQLLPESYNQMRTVTLNYEVLRNIYHARKSHKLNEWHKLCAWIETLPYSELITEV